MATPQENPNLRPSERETSRTIRVRRTPKISISNIERDAAKKQIEAMTPVASAVLDGIDESKEGSMVNPVIGRLASGLVVAGTDIGGRDSQEDKLYINGEKGVVAAADGMGGHEGGEIASDEFTKKLDEELKTGKDWNESLAAAKAAIANAVNKNADATDAGLTFAGFQVEGDELNVRHAGDSRVMIFTLDGEEVNRTIDENEATVIGKAQGVSQDSIDNHTYPGNYSGVVNSLKLKDGKVEGNINVNRMPIKENQIAVVCSDGITDALSAKEIGTLIRKAKGNISLAYKYIEREIAKRNGRSDAKDYESQLKKYGIAQPSEDNRTLALYINKQTRPSEALTRLKATAKIEVKDAQESLKELLESVSAVAADPVKALRQLLVGIKSRNIPTSLTGSALLEVLKNADPLDFKPSIPDKDLRDKWQWIVDNLKKEWTSVEESREEMKKVRQNIEAELAAEEESRQKVETEKAIVESKETALTRQEREKIGAILTVEEAERIARRTDIMNPTADAYRSAMRDLAEDQTADEQKIEKAYDVAKIYENQPWYSKVSARIGNWVDKGRALLDRGAKAVDHGIRGVGETLALNLNERAQNLRENGNWFNRNISARALDAVAWASSELAHFTSIALVKSVRVAGTVANFAAHGAVNVVKDTVLGGLERLIRGKDKIRAEEIDKLSRVFNLDEETSKALDELDKEFPGMKVKILRDLLAINNERGAQKLIKEYTDEEHEEFAFGNADRQARKQALLEKYSAADRTGFKHSMVAGRSFRAFGRTWQWPGLAKMPLGGFFVKSYKDSEGRHQERLSLNLSGGVLGLLTMVDTMTDSLSAAHHTAQRGPRNFLTQADIQKYLGLLKHEHLNETLRSKTDGDRKNASSYLKKSIDESIIFPAINAVKSFGLSKEDETEVVERYLAPISQGYRTFLEKISQEKAGQQDRIDAFAEFVRTFVKPLSKNHALNQIYASVQTQYLQHAEAAMAVDYTDSTSPRYQASEWREGAWESLRRTGLPYAGGRIVKTKWSFVLAKTALAHSGLLSGGVAALGAHSASAFLNPQIALLAGVSVLKDAVSEAMYNGAIQDMLKANKGENLKALTDLYKGRTMFGEEIPADIQALQEQADKTQYQKLLGRWILNRVRQNITNPNAIRAWAQELGSLAFDSETNTVDTTKAVQAAQILQELLTRFEKGEIAGRGQGIVFNTASELVEGRDLNQFIRAQLSAVELHLDNEQRGKNIAERLSKIKQGSTANSLRKGLKYGALNAVTDFEKTFAKLAGTFIYQGPLLVVDQTILHTLEENVAQVPYLGSVYAPVMEVINAQTHLVQGMSSIGERGGFDALLRNLPGFGAAGAGVAAREAPREAGRGPAPEGTTVSAPSERPTTETPRTEPSAPVAGAETAPTVTTLSVAGETFDMSDPRVGARGREGTMIDFLHHHGISRAGATNVAGRIAHLFELEHVAPADSEFRREQRMSHPTDTITIRVEGDELIMESRRYTDRSHTTLISGDNAVATARAPLSEVARWGRISEADLRAALSGGAAVTETVPAREGAPRAPRVAAAVESAGGVERPSERAPRERTAPRERVRAPERVEAPVVVAEAPTRVPEAVAPVEPSVAAREEERFSPRHLIRDAERRELVSSHATESRLDVHGYGAPGHIAVESRTPGLTGRVVFRVVRNADGTFEVRQADEHGTGIFSPARGMHGSLDEVLARLRAQVERREVALGRERPTEEVAAAPVETPRPERRGARTRTPVAPIEPTAVVEAEAPRPTTITGRITERVRETERPAPREEARVEAAAPVVEAPTEPVVVAETPVRVPTRETETARPTAIDNDTRVGLSDMLNADPTVHEHLDVAPYGTTGGVLRIDGMEGRHREGRAIIRVARNADGTYTARPIGTRTGVFEGMTDADLTGSLPEVLSRLSNRVEAGSGTDVASTSSTVLGSRTSFAGYEREARARIVPVIQATDFEVPPARAVETMTVRLNQEFRNARVGEVMDDVRDDFLHLFPVEGPQEQLRILRGMNGYGYIHSESTAMARDMLDVDTGANPWAARLTTERIEMVLASSLDGGTVSARELASELGIPTDDEHLRSPAVQRAISHLHNLASYASSVELPEGMYERRTWRDILARGAERRSFRIDPEALYREHPTGRYAMLAMYQDIADVDGDNTIEIPASGESISRDILVRLDTGEAGTESNLYSWLLEMRTPGTRTSARAVIRDMEDLRALGEEYLHSEGYLAAHPSARDRTASEPVTQITVSLTDRQREAIRYGLLIASQRFEHDARRTVDHLREERDASEGRTTTSTGSSVPVRIDAVDRAVLTRVAPSFASRENLNSLSDADLRRLRESLATDLASHPRAPDGMSETQFREHISHETALVERIDGLLLQRGLLSETNADRMAREMSDAIFRERGVRISAARIRQELLTIGAGGGVVFRPGSETTWGAGIGARVTPFTVTSDDGRHTFTVGVDMGVGVGGTGGSVGGTAGVGVDARYSYRIAEGTEIFTGVGAGISVTGPAAGAYVGVRTGLTDDWDGSLTVAGGVGVSGLTLGGLLGAEYNARRDFENTRARIVESMGLTDPESTSLARQRVVVERYASVASERLTDAQVRQRYAQLWRGIETAALEEINPNGVTGFGLGVGVVNGIVAFGPYIRFTVGSHMVYEVREVDGRIETARIEDLNARAIRALRGARSSGPEGSSITTYRIHIESPDVGTTETGALAAISGTGGVSETIVRYDDTRERTQIINAVLREAHLGLEGDRLTIRAPSDTTEYRFISHVDGLTVSASPDGRSARLTTSPEVGGFTIVRRRIINATALTAGEHDSVEVVIFVPEGMSEGDLNRMLTEDTINPAQFVSAEYLSGHNPEFVNRLADTRRRERVIYHPSEEPGTVAAGPVPVGDISESTVAGTMTPEVRAATLRVYESFTTDAASIESFRRHANDARRRHFDSDAAWRRDMIEFVQGRATQMGIDFPANYNWDYLLGSLVMASNVSNISNLPLARQREEVVERLHSAEWSPAPLFRHGPRMSARTREGVEGTMERLIARVPSMTGVGPSHADEGSAVPTGATYRILSRYGTTDRRYGFRTGTATEGNHPILAISETAHLTPDASGPDAAYHRHVFRTLETEERTAVRTYRFFYSVLNAEERAVFERAARDPAARSTPEAQALIAEWQALTREVHDRAAEGAPSVRFSRGDRTYTIGMTTTVGTGIFSTDSNPDTDPTRGYCGNVTIFADLDLAADFEVVRPGGAPARAYRDLYNVPTEVEGRREGGISFVLGAAVGIAPAAEVRPPPPGHPNTPPPRVPPPDIPPPDEPGHPNTPSPRVPE